MGLVDGERTDGNVQGRSVEHIDTAIELLKRARQQLVLGRAPKTADRVRLALSSAKGALRHARHMESRERGGRPAIRQRRSR